MKKFIAISLAIVAISGCDQVERAVSDHYAKSSLELVFEKDLSSPDNALKSWWKYLDAVEKRQFENCGKYLERTSSRENYYSGFTTGEAFNVNSNRLKGCVLDTFSREIQEVKQETETRAIALVKIKNTTQSSMTPSADDKAAREKGAIYRYLIEKEKGEWKVSQVYKFSTYSFDKNDPWQPEYKRYPDSYPSGVYKNQ